MSFTSVWPYFIIMPILLLVAQLIASWIPFWRTVTERHPKGRYESLEGLRGFLATGVFFVHALIHHFYFAANRWGVVNSEFYPKLGGISICMFFSITGFLFWSKAIAGKLEWRSLYIGRVRRLAPAFIGSSLAIIIAAQIFIGIHFSSVRQVISQLIPFAFMGALPLHFLGTVQLRPVNAGVTWTLGYEWLFYLSLPILSRCVKIIKFVSLIAILLLLLSVEDHRKPLSQSAQIDTVRYFFVGMTAAYLIRWLQGKDVARWFLDCLAMAGLASAFFFANDSWVAGTLSVLVALVSILSGASVFGLLTIRGARLLGTVSYSFYLSHGIIIFCLVQSSKRYRPHLLQSPTEYWALMTFAVLLALFWSMFLFRVAEFPFMAKSMVASTPLNGGKLILPVEKLAPTSVESQHAPSGFI